MKAQITTFRAATPRISDKLLTVEGATIAKDCLLSAGDIRPVGAPAKLKDLPAFASYDAKTIFQWWSGAANYWMQFPDFVDVVRGPVADDVYKRIYWTGDSRFTGPRMAYTPGISTGSGPLPGASYKMGIPAPTTPVVVHPNPDKTGAIAMIYNERPIRVTTVSPHTLSWGDMVSLDIESGAPEEIAVTELTLSGTTVTVTTDETHNLSANNKITIAGADQTEYNGSFRVVSVPDDTSFTYTITPPETPPASPATGTITVRRASGSSLADYLRSGNFQVSVIDDTTFTLNDSDASNIDYDSFLSGSWSEYIDPGTVSARFYVFTYVSEIGEEGPPCPVSEQVDLGPTQGAALELPGLDGALSGNYNIQTIRIYRTATGNQSASFFFVAEVPVSDTFYQDDAVDTALGETLPSGKFDPPPDGLSGLAVAAQGFGVGFYDNVVCFSEPYQLHAWPTNYQLALENDVVAIAVVDGGVVVATNAKPYLIQGIDPRSMTQRQLDMDYACVSKRSMVAFGNMAYYAAQNGLVAIDAGGNARMVTAGIFSPQQWQALNPSTLFACQLDGFYVGFSSAGTFMLDPRNPEGGAITSSVTGVVNTCFDSRYPGVYLLKNRNNTPDPGTTPEVWQWDLFSGDPMPYEWQSRIFTLPIPVCASAAQVRIMPDADNPTTFTLFADGQQKYQREIADNEPFWCPGGYLAREFQVKVEGYGTVEQITFGESMEEVQQ